MTRSKLDIINRHNRVRHAYAAFAKDLSSRVTPGSALYRHGLQKIYRTIATAEKLTWKHVYAIVKGVAGVNTSNNGGRPYVPTCCKTCGELCPTHMSARSHCPRKAGKGTGKSSGMGSGSMSI